MTEENLNEEGCPELPVGVEKSLCDCGGIEGLKECLPAETDIEAICNIHRVLADQNRMKILAMLNVQPLCVCVIKVIMDIADSKLSYHLSVLKKAGFVTGEQQGNWIVYNLTEKGREWFLSGNL
ncbi:ArsR/SmtB family transcription factor [Methanoplanus endosymbiosus]|uniref:Metalloregulator ArsR/SmtB family transcription factor n=1 Tax=Methanoplanus endosymbiosus TaxID=33865 RepID=A0A9E7PSW6_9EURY|nr:metalloregulator ArsR/SmtB family transcription factor [Methanoplanus endosymbiosus]UUX93202.1 metalloregulator ArsR/SmtB family transcription factor [Methanoplanus endosymbiosus]